jgi:hypothetical protein
MANWFWTTIKIDGLVLGGERRVSEEKKEYGCVAHMFLEQVL